MAFSPFFFDVPSNSPKQIVNADSTNLVTILSAAANATKLLGLIATSDDTVARVVTWGYSRGGTFYPLGTKSVAIGSGTVAGTPATNLLDPANVLGLPFDNDGNPFIFLESGDTLQAKSAVAVTAGKAISISAIHGDDD